MTSFARLKPFYASLNIRNNALDSKNNNADIYDPATSADSTVMAMINEDYNAPLVDKASDYIMCVERMELSLNGIPFYDTRTNQEQIYVRSRTNLALPAIGTPIIVLAFTLSDLLDELGKISLTDPNTNSDFSVSYTIDPNGYIKLVLKNGKLFTNLQIEFPRRLNMILGISTAVQLAGRSVARSLYTRLDTGDDMGQIVIQSNLPTLTDSVGNERMPILTDFAIPSNYSSSFGYNGLDLVQQGWSMSLRDKLIYFPSERRYLDLNGDFPINNITISAWYVSATGETKPVMLPLGGLFQIKLGFYLKQ